MTRTPQYPIDPRILNRWSPRAMSGEEISNEDLMSLFEAARWAPSASNEQPWRFQYARRNSPHWDLFFNLLVPGNQAWGKNAAALVVALSRKTFSQNGKPNGTHSFDAGAAWENLALQGSLKGLVVHGMAGFDHEKARELLKIPEDHHINAMIALGRPGKLEDLPEKFRPRETPSDRKPISDLVFEGPFAP